MLASVASRALVPYPTKVTTPLGNHPAGWRDSRPKAGLDSRLTLVGERALTCPGGRGLASSGTSEGASHCPFMTIWAFEPLSAVLEYIVTDITIRTGQMRRPNGSPGSPGPGQEVMSISTSSMSRDVGNDSPQNRRNRALRNGSLVLRGPSPIGPSRLRQGDRNPLSTKPNPIRSLSVNLRIGRIGKIFAPGYSWCMRCETPWPFVRSHVTDYGDRGHGCFPLCEKCWAEMTPQRRIPFYHCLIWDWHHQPDGVSRGLPFDQEWAQVETAVLNGG